MASKATQPKTRSRAALRRAFKLLVASMLGFLLLEGLLRYSLFGSSALADRLGAYTRDARLYSTAKDDDAYWILNHTFSGKRQVVPGPDPILGWRGKKSLRKGDYAHLGSQTLAGRQPILMFGDSYTACVTSIEDCWEGLFEAGPLGQDAAILNYGVGGYGVDQIYLLLREALLFWDTHPESLPPQVIVAIMVDDDLDRVALSVRDWPKPHFTLGDELVCSPPLLAQSGPFAPVIKPEITSYVWRCLVYGTDILPSGLRERLMGRQRIREQKQALNARLIEEMQLELDSRGLDSFFVMFPGMASLASAKPWSWQEPMLEETFDMLDIRYVNAKNDLRRDMAASGRHAMAYFGKQGNARGHYSPNGNRIAMQAIYRGLAGADDGKPTGSQPK